MLYELIGKIYRLIPPVKGKGKFAQMTIAPFVRGKGHELIVDMKSPGGGLLIYNLDDLIPWYVYLYGRYQIEKNYEEFLLKKSVGGKVIFDIGANIGYYSIQLGRMIGQGGKIYSFEPCSYQFNILERNIELNKLTNIIPEKLIVSDRHGGVKKIYFSGISNTGSSSLEVKTDEFEEMDCVTVDKFCQNNNINSIDLVKIDVEGHELRVVKGMERMLDEAKVKNLFLEINNYALEEAGTTALEIIEYLDSFNYRPYSIATGTANDYAIGHSESLVYFCKQT